MTTIRLDGIRLKVNDQIDMNNDGSADDVEILQNPMGAGQTEIVQSSELGDIMKELNTDFIDKHTRMSGIDLKARLHHAEISSVLALDALVALGVCPTSCLAFTRQKKRLSVSLQGQGRKEMVDITVGKREQDARAGMGGFGDSMKSFFGGKNGQS